MVLKARHYLPSLLLLKQLHWLPVVYQIKNKLATVTYRTLSTQQLTYLVNLLHFSDIFRTLVALPPNNFFVPKIKQNIGKRAFSVAAPAICNQLPIAIKFLAVPCSNDNSCLSLCMNNPTILFVAPLGCRSFTIISKHNKIF